MLLRWVCYKTSTFRKFPSCPLVLSLRCAIRDLFQVHEDGKRTALQSINRANASKLPILRKSSRLLLLQGHLFHSGEHDSPWYLPWRWRCVWATLKKPSSSSQKYFQQYLEKNRKWTQLSPPRGRQEMFREDIINVVQPRRGIPQIKVETSQLWEIVSLVLFSEKELKRL